MLNAISFKWLIQAIAVDSAPGGNGWRRGGSQPDRDRHDIRQCHLRQGRQTIRTSGRLQGVLLRPDENHPRPMTYYKPS